MDIIKIIKIRRFLTGGLVLFFCLAILKFIILAQETPFYPTIIVPGIGGSWNWDVMFNKIFGDSWNFMPFTHIYDGLIKSLENAGYEKDKDFFIAFYDWRKPNFDSAINYLKQTINQAKQISGKDKVNIVAHSMGGLVTRAYIISNHYQNDIDKFIMLGTPNYGSSDVYTLWEGGYVPRNWDFSQSFIIRIYLTYLNWLNKDARSSYEVIHQDVPSIQEMLPVYDYLQDKQTGDIKPYDLMQEQNLFLQILNNQENINKLFERVGEVIVIAGEGFDTVNTIPVVARNENETPLWADGKPEPLDPERNDEVGDNRVLLSSALFRFDSGGGNLGQLTPKNILVKFFTNLIKKVYAQFGGIPINYREIIRNSSHGNLPYEAIADIFSILEFNLATIPAPYPQFSQELIVMVGSPITIKITDPTGRIVSEAQVDIPYAEFSKPPASLGPKMIFIPNPLEGEYKIELEGLADGEYHLGVQVLADDLNIFKEISGQVSQAEKLIYNLNFDPANSNEPVGDLRQQISIDNIINAVNRFYENGQIKHNSAGKVLKVQLLAKLEIIKALYNKPPSIKIKAVINQQIESSIKLIKKYHKKDIIENEASQILIQMLESLKNN